MFVRTTLKKKTHGGMVSLDKRGYHVPPNKISDDIRDGAKNILSQFQQLKAIIAEKKLLKNI